MATGDLKQNISGNITQELLAPGNGVDIKSILIANTHASDAVTVKLYIEKQNLGRFSIFNGLTINAGTSIFLKEEVESINNDSNGFGLYIQLSASTSTVDVIIN
jgi:hypothetical protein|tara:strand:- start:320 stop:631 length:312 start_codon:yes stop_codon:yes gene_type:complete